MHLLFRFVLPGDHFETRYNFDERIYFIFCLRKPTYEQSL